ncbi:MAG: UDP-N-acetylmuramoyl-L-alanyl-D-glutamate--2,6-diaminopimelate ligase [Sphingomonadales bacterium]|nr:UDP-N-acetylmuramoyl-L-alanyl-D-glutamate--2,6-diaminopimelate ligase [Sphingomonadales bacterium]
MRLSKLAGRNGSLEQVEVSGLTADSREVAPGYLFAAFKGTRDDGRRFIPDAVKQGAVAILADADTKADTGKAVLLKEANPRLSYAKMAARFFGRQPETAVAVTGTNGKTSVVSFTRQIWQRLGRRAGSIGTLGIEGDGIAAPGGLTTPDALKLHRALSELAQAGIDRVAFEASSHGLAQHRVDGVRLKAAAFTNITRDHLDYHADFADYLYAKARLFGELLPPDGVAVINLASPVGIELEHLAWARGLRIITVGPEGATIQVKSRTPDRDGQRLLLRIDSEDHPVRLPLIGAFQAENAVLAAGLVMATGEAPKDVFAALEHLKGVPGRLEFAGRAPSGGGIYIDYAHTPDGLRNLLAAAREHACGGLHVVFGCGGDRDTGKRPEMGAIAAEAAERVIVTDDNPRSEDPAAIRAQILAAAPGAEEIGDRAEAIRAGIAGLGPDNFLLVTGKGHERGQIVDGKVLPFSDFDEVQKVLADPAQESVR